MAVNVDDQSEYLWARTGVDACTMTRKLTNLERMFVIFNRDLHGQNCPFIGATINLRESIVPSQRRAFDLAGLQKRAVEAFCHTRWRYPTVAARVVGDDKATYVIETDEQVRKWAERTVRIVTDYGGWYALRERVSRSLPIPSPEGDYCLMYLIVQPEEVARGELTTFDILMHTHQYVIFCPETVIDSGDEAPSSFYSAPWSKKLH